jgi:hypothetical protein
MKKLVTFLALACLLLITNETAQAVITGGGRFDQLIGNAKIIVKGQINRIDKQPHFEMIAFGINITKVLKSDDGNIPEQLYFEAPFPLWPEDLNLPYTEGQLVLLVLGRDKGKLYIENNTGAILPAANNKTTIDENSPVTRKVFEELRAYLDQTRDETAKGLVLVYLSQLGTIEDVNLFLPYSKSENKWLRRAALASLLRLRHNPEDINEAVADFAGHLSDGQQEFLFWKMYEDVKWSARCGSFGMEKQLADRARAYLPIYRVLIDKVPDEYYQHVYVAIEALKDIGTREDIPRLYKYIDNDKAWIRHDILEGIGRILGMNIKRPIITGYGATLSEEAKAWEEKTMSIIEQKLVSEHILVPNKGTQ